MKIAELWVQNDIAMAGCQNWVCRWVRTSEKESTCILPSVHSNEYVITYSSFMWLEIHASTEEFTLFLYVRTPLVIASHNLFPRGQKDALTSHLIHAN